MIGLEPTTLCCKCGFGTLGFRLEELLLNSQIACPAVTASYRLVLSECGPFVVRREGRLLFEEAADRKGSTD
jgi:hypothetical protein